METIGQTELWSFFDDADDAKKATNTEVRSGAGHKVESFLDLATKVAELQFRNRDHVLLFRGQRNDHLNQDGNTTLKPTLLRPGRGRDSNPGEQRLTRRFEILRQAEQVLVSRYKEEGLLGVQRLKRQRILRWSILQHYKVCATPLLDVTHSLRIAASFASIRATDIAYVFVLGVPNLSGAVTASSEGGLQIIRLSSVCPPSAVRPHIQEGYLLGEYPDMADFEQKENYKHYEVDFGRRLVAKFVFEPKSFWKRDVFPRVSKKALYPDSSDPIFRLVNEIKRAIDTSED